MYIGETEDVSRRWVEHLTDLVSNEHCNKKLQDDFNKYGIKNFLFEVIESIIIDNNDNSNVSVFKLKMTLLCRETFYIRKYNTIEDGYNIVDSIKETLTNKCDIFYRNRTQSIETSFMIRNFLKNNFKLLNSESAIITNEDILIKEKVKNINANKPKIKETKKITDIIIKKSKNKKDKNEYFRDIGCLGMNEIYTLAKENKLISDIMKISEFRMILQDNNIIHFENGSWHTTQSSLDNKLILLGDLKNNKDKFTYNQLWFTPNGIKVINSIFNINKGSDVI
jgi:group I intron endonuclease